jgi:ribosomal protein S18 acetylase RimI-like enzyme
MSSLSLPLIPRKKSGNIRQVNILRDLPNIADLVELCFHQNMDNEGKRYVEQMREAGKKRNSLQWLNKSMPLMGFIWEENGQIVGNISIVPFAKRNYLLANIAVHPEYRQRGIARQLTERGMQFVRERNANAIWLHVEKENDIAIHLYRKLGFQDKALRATWEAPQKSTPQTTTVPITTQVGRYWTHHANWLSRDYPASLRWYRMPDFQILAPGIKNWFYRIFVEYDIRQWALTDNRMPQAILTWIPTHTKRTPLWLAAAPQVDAAALAELLQHARARLISRSRELYIDYPADQHTAAFQQAGFNLRRTLLWMQASGSSEKSHQA